MIKAIIYDVDDLMVDSFSLHVKASEILLAKYGRSLIEIPEEKRASYIGRRVVDIIKDIIEFLQIDVEIGEFIKKREEIFNKLGKKSLGELIAWDDKNGIKISELTSSPQRIAANELYKKSGFILHPTNHYLYKLEKN